VQSGLEQAEDAFAAVWADYTRNPRAVNASEQVCRHFFLTAWNTRAPSDAALVEALEEVMGVAELYVPVPLSAPGFKRARAALAAAKGQQPALDRNTVNGDE